MTTSTASLMSSSCRVAAHRHDAAQAGADRRQQAVARVLDDDRVGGRRRRAARGPAGRSPGRASWPARRRPRRRRSAPRRPGRRRARAPRGPTPRPTSRPRRASSRPASASLDDAGDAGAAGQPAGADHLLVDRSVLRRCHPASSSFWPSGSAGRSLRAHELVGQQRGHPLLAAADAQLLGVLLHGPLHVEPGLGEGLVERGPVAVALGVGEHAVAVEDQRGHAARTAAELVVDARPADPKIRMWCSAISLTAARTCARSDGGSCLAGVGVQVLAVGVDERDLQRRRDVDLGAAARDEVGELRLGQPGAAVQDHRDRVLARRSR